MNGAAHFYLEPPVALFSLFLVETFERDCLQRSRGGIMFLRALEESEVGVHFHLLIDVPAS